MKNFVSLAKLKNYWRRDEEDDGDEDEDWAKQVDDVAFGIVGDGCVLDVFL